MCVCVCVCVCVGGWVYLLLLIILRAVVRYVAAPFSAYVREHPNAQNTQDTSPTYLSN